MVIFFAGIAAGAALMTWWIHTFIGGSEVLGPLKETPMDCFAKATMEVCWHVITYILAGLALTLIVASVHSSVNVRYYLLGFGIVLTVPFTGLFCLVSKKRFGRWLAMPQAYLLGSIAGASLLAFLIPVKVPLVTGLGFGLGCLLLVLAYLHFKWALGSTWPTKSRAELTQLVVGQPAGHPFPGRNLTILVALCFGLAGSWLGIGAFFGPNQAALVIFAWFLAIVFIGRGILGYFEPILRPWTKRLPYGYWNQVLYSPICLLMGFMAMVMAIGGY